MRVYNLTAAPFALSNIALRRLKISRFSDLNDPFELLAVDLADREQRKAFRETRDELNEDKGLICFSKSWSNPVLWGHYADRHTGVALGFDVRQELLNKVIYAKTPTKVPVDKSGRPVVSDELMSRLLRTKFFDWKYEEEYRLFVELDIDLREEGLFFADFDDDLVLREVILGPRCSLPIDRVRSLVREYDPAVEVIKARIAFSTFRVVENRYASRK